MDGTKDTLKPTLSEKVRGIVWKILVNETNHLMAVESRDPDNKQVYFSVFDYKDGLPFFKNKTLNERWNVSITHLAAESLLLKNFPAASNPVSKGVISLNCKTGNMQWEKYNISYQNVWQEGLEVFNPDILPVKFHLLDLKTGNEINATGRSPVNSSIVLPVPADTAILPDWLHHSEIAGHVLYLKANEKEFLAFHEKTSKNIRLRLVVFGDGVILLDLILKEDIQKLLPEAFFIVQNHLFCIRGNNEVVSYLV